MTTPPNPEQPSGQPNQQPQVVYVEKQKKPIYKRPGCIVPIAIVVILFVIIAIAMSGGDDTNSSGASGNNADEASGPAAIGETVSLPQADVTAGDLRPSSDAIGSYICTDISVVNTTEDDTVNLNGLMDWELQDPNGVIRSQGFGGETNYDSVELAPGGTISGTVCFDGDATPGDYTLTFEEGLSFNTDRAEWAATL